MAAECYREVLRLSPNHLAANRGLERYYTSQNSVRELVAVLDREVQSAKSSFSKLAPLLKLAYVYLDALGELSRAVQCCEAALEIDEKNITALKLLERIYSTERSRNSELKSRLAESVGDGRARAAFALSAAASSNGDPHKRAQLKRAFEEDPANSELASALEHLLRQAEDPKELLDMYQKRLSALTDDSERIELAMRMAEVARYRAGDFTKAMEAYVAALRINPQLLPALQGTREVALALGDYAAAVKALEAEAAASKDNQGRLEVYLAAGCIAAEKLSEPDSAIAHFRRALEIDPSNGTAKEWLEQILCAPGHAKEFAEFHESTTLALLERGETHEAADHLTKAALAWADEIHDRDKAISAVDRALRAEPSQPDALALRGRLMLEAKSYPEAAEAFSARIRLGGSPEALLAFHRQLGMIFQDHLHEFANAAVHLHAALTASPEDGEALERLSRIHCASANWKEAAACLTRLLELDLPPQRAAEHTLALARVCDEGLAESGRAMDLYRKVLEMGTEDLSVVHRLGELHQKAGTTPKFLELIDGLTSRSANRGYATQLRIKLGEFNAKVLNQGPTAAGHYRRALSAEPSNVAARIGLAEALSTDPTFVHEAIREYREVLRQEPLRLECLHALCRLWSQRHRDKASAPPASFTSCGPPTKSRRRRTAKAGPGFLNTPIARSKPRTCTRFCTRAPAAESSTSSARSETSSGISIPRCCTSVA